MSDTYTEVTSQNWFSRIGESVKGILFGLIAIPLAIILLWWNEGRAVTTANSLKEGAAAVISVPPEKIDPANEGKLIHVSGEASAADPVSDSVFRIATAALRLERKEEIYQWVEDQKTETKQKTGGSEESITTYTYAKKWVDAPVDSSAFKQPAGHGNKGALIAGNEHFNARRVTLGAFQIPESFVSRMGGARPHPVTEADLEKLPPNLREGAQVHATAFYFGAEPEVPQIGDRRVSFEAVKPGPFSILAAQSSASVAPYQTKAGDAIDFIETGTVDAKTMFQNAVSANKLLTWLLRLAGFVVMAIAFALIMRPLSVLGSIVPFIGNVIGAGTGMIAFVLAATISLGVIAIAWLFARPVLGILLLALTIGGFIYTRKIAARTRPVSSPVAA
ncbi:MAG TPA: TMEM43 family protein [Prosthecobacter sp.]|nr:TMEM43 family protein [Prosthecobacter sp.]